MADNTLKATVLGDSSQLKYEFAATADAVEKSLAQLRTEYAATSVSVKTATQNMAQATQEFSAAAVAGNTVAAAALQQYQVELRQAVATNNAAQLAFMQAAQAAQAAAAALKNTAAAAGGVPPSINGVTNAVNSASVGMRGFYIGMRIVIAAVREFNAFVDATENIQLFSLATGESVETLAGLQGAFDLAGSHGSKLIGIIDGISRTQELAKEHNKIAADELHRLGITATDAHGKLSQLANTLYNTKDKYEALAVAQRVTSSTSDVLLGALAGGAAQLDKNIAASKEYADAITNATTPVHELVVEEGRLKQAFATIEAESIPGILAMLKFLAVGFENLIIGPIKLAADTAIQGFLIIKDSATSSAKIVKDIMHGNLFDAKDEAKAGLSLLREDYARYVSDIKQDSVDVQEFYKKIYAPIDTPTTKPGNTPFPKPKPEDTKNSAGEEEENAALAHNDRMAAIERDATKTAVKLQQEQDSVIIESLENKHERAIALAQEELLGAIAIQVQNDITNKKLLADNLAVLEAKEEQQRADSKNSQLEVATSEAKKQEIRDQYTKQQKADIDAVAIALGKLSVTEVTQQREALDESTKLLNEWAAKAKETLDKAAETFRKVSDINTQRRAAEEIDELTQKKLALQREYDLSLDHTAAAARKLAEQEIALDRLILDVRLNALAEEAEADKSNAVKYAQDQRDMAQVNRQGTAQITAATTAALVHDKQIYTQFFNQINTEFANSVAKWVTGQKSFVASMRQLMNQVVVEFIAGLIKMTIQRGIQNAIQLNMQATAAAAGTSITFMQALTQGLIFAKQAAQGAYSAIAGIPIIGPLLAPGAAATAAGAVLALETGGIVPNTGMALVHKNEAVLPAQLTSMLMNTANSGAGGGGGGITIGGGIHVHNPGSEASGKKIGQDIQTSLRASLRKMNVRPSQSSRPALG